MRIILNSRGREERTRASWVVLATAGAILLSACAMSTSASQTNGRVQVVAAENFWGSIARQVAGPDAVVTSLISNPATDPHDYEPTPADARAIASSGLVIENGIGYDQWVRQLRNADDTAGRRVLDVGDLLGVPDGGNPHQWYSRAAVIRVIDRMAEDLAAVDPAHHDGYVGRARALRRVGLAEYDARTNAIRSTYAGVAIGGSESLVSVWAAGLALRVVTPRSFMNAVAEGNEPSAADKATVDTQIRQHAIAVFVFNRQNLTPDVQRLVDDAHAAHIPTVAVTETLVPASATFQAWQVRQLRALAVALDEAARR